MNSEMTPSGHKRTHSRSEDAGPTPTALKKRKVDQPAGAASIFAAKAPGTDLSKSSAFWPGEKTQDFPTSSSKIGSSGEPAVQVPAQSSTQPPPQPKPAANFRPAIKLKALRGTIWDTGEPRKPAALPKKVGPGRPRKKPDADEGEGTPKPTPKKRGRKPKVQVPVDDADQEATADGSPTKSQSVKRTKAVAPDVQTDDRDSTDELAATTGILGSARKPGSNLLFDSPRGSPLKGILTPTKKRGPRGRKNVTFGHDANGEVFFEDLPKKPKQPAVPAADEIVCEICSKPDSQAPNQIILCDNCDFAVHQECYGVPEIPEGDWLCKSCEQEDILRTPKKAADVEATRTAADIPEIPNLDQHVRSLQRVLLDRCTGRRRIRMSGEVEAHEKVHQLIEQTVVAGEGNSMLLIGARGCGKTTVSVLTPIYSSSV